MDAAAGGLLLVGLAVGGGVGAWVGAALQRAPLQAALRSERALSEQRLAAAREESQRMTAEFERLSARALASSNEQFLRLAAERLTASEALSAAELEKREQAVAHLVRPLAESLTEVRRQLSEVEKSREGAYRELRQQVVAMSQTSEQLRSETASLVTALRAPQVRGRWGEMQLRRVVESAGMLEHCDFDEQASTATDDGVLRPDMVVRLAGGRNVVVDAKVSFLGYLEAIEAKDEATAADRLQAHARQLRSHVDGLAGKAYWRHLEPTPDFVVMFVPAEAFLTAALEKDPALLEYAFERHVVVATPQTLLALLRTVAYAWKQDAVAANAEQVYALGKELHGRLSTMGSHLARLGTQLNASVTAYNATVSSLESRVLVTARKLGALQVSDDDLSPAPPVEVVARPLHAPELVASAQARVVALDDPDARGGSEPGVASPTVER